MNSCANSVDSDETAHNEPSHQDLQFAIPFFILDWNPYLHQWKRPNSGTEESISETQGWKS